MVAGSHFGCPKITLYQINTTIFIFVKFFTKWLPAAILDVRKSLSVAFLAISDQYATFLLNCFTKWLPSAILDIRNSLWITFLAILDQYKKQKNLNLFLKFYKMATGGHFGCPKITFDLISDHFRSIHNFVY